MPGASAASADPADSTRVARASRRAGRLVGRADVLSARIRPWMVLGPLVVASWLVAALIGRDAVHTGRLYAGAGSTMTYTSAWVLAHGLIPVALVGYAYPMLLAPFARIAGPNLLEGAPYAIVIDVAVLGPIALLCVYGLAKGIGGRRFAYAVSTLWVVAPLLAIHYFLLDYHRRLVGLQLPGDLGLTTLADFPSMVAVLVSAYFAFRAIVSGEDIDAATSGLAAGIAIAVRPANAAFLPAAFLALAVARRWRGLGAFTLGLVPSLLGLALWKERGLGHIPGLSGHVSWNRFTHNIDGFREYTWSRRLVEWSVIAGLVGLFRRSIPGAVLIGGWLASYLVFVGGSSAEFYGGTYFRFLAPAIPAAFLLVVSLPFLIPVAGRRLAAHGDLATWPASRRSRRAVLGAGAFLAIAPLVPIVAFTRQGGASAAIIPGRAAFVPANAFPLNATVHGARVTLAWPGQSSGGAHVRYAVFRTRTDALVCTRPSGGAVRCTFPPVATAATRVPGYTDTPPPGRWTYRVAALSGVPPPAREPILLSRMAAVTVG